MSSIPVDARKLQAAYTDLVVGFIAPLLTGDQAAGPTPGENGTGPRAHSGGSAPGPRAESVARLGRPLAPGALEYFATARSGDPDADDRIFDALHRGGSEVAPIETIPWPSRDLIAIAMVMHNLAFLTDPGLDRLFARGARAVVLDWIDRELDLVEPPATRGEALARHALIEPFFRAQREDVVVRNWAYTYRFFGRPVPSNVTAMPRLRMVTQESTRLDLMGLLTSLDEQGETYIAPRLRALVARSPVTELSRPDRFAPLQFGLAGLRVLCDPLLRGGIARSIAAREWECAKALGAAIAPLASAPPPLLMPAAHLLLEASLTAALDTRTEPRLPGSLDPASARYAAMLPAWLEDPLAVEDIRALDDGDRAIVQRRAERLRRLIPGPILAEAHVLVKRARTHPAAVPGQEPLHAPSLEVTS